MERIWRVCGYGWWRSFCFFSCFFSGKFLRGKEGKEEGEEDRLKSAMRIKSFCHDIVYFENGVFGRWKLLDLDKNMERNDYDIGSFALKNDGGMPKILFLAKWGNFWQDFWQFLGKGLWGKEEGFQLPKMIWKVPKTGCGMPKILFLAEWGDFWQDFWHFEMHFWQITGVRIAGEPIKWAFVGNVGKCQKYSFWQWSRCFWQFGEVFGRLQL